MPFVRRFAASLVATALASGCILVANDDPSKLGTTCSFSGSDGMCGKCIVDNCTTALNACCGKPSCAGSLGNLDSCAGGQFGILTDPGACEALAGPASELYACIAGACGSASACGPFGDAGFDAPGPESGPTKGPFCSGGSGSCSCTAGNANGMPCTPTSVGGNGVCCGDSTWPNSGSCRCDNFTCSDDGGGYVTCGLGLSSGTLTSCSGGCTDGRTYCTCDPTVYPNCTGMNETAVAVCDTAALGCGSQTQWSSCTN